MKHCCRNMEQGTRTREEWASVLAEKGLDAAEIAAEIGDPPEPLVRFEPRGFYVIGHTVISYCPWCGAKLPDIGDLDNKIIISVDSAGSLKIINQ